MYSITQCTHTETYTQWLGQLGRMKTRFSRGYLIPAPKWSSCSGSTPQWVPGTEWGRSTLNSEATRRPNAVSVRAVNPRHQEIRFAMDVTEQWVSKCGLQVSSISIAKEHVQKCKFSDPQTLEMGSIILFLFQVIVIHVQKCENHIIDF